MEKPKHVLAQEDTVLFVGSGISLWSWLPSWSGVIEELATCVESAGATAALRRPPSAASGNAQPDAGTAGHLPVASRHEGYLLAVFVGTSASEARPLRTTGSLSGNSATSDKRPPRAST